MSDSVIGAKPYGLNGPLSVVHLFIPCDGYIYSSNRRQPRQACPHRFCEQHWRSLCGFNRAYTSEIRSPEGQGRCKRGCFD